MKNALILINSCFPFGAAISSRVLNFARLVHNMGYSVHVISEYGGNQTDSSGKICSFESISYQVIIDRKPNSFDSFFGSQIFIQETTNYIKKNNVDFVYMTSLTEMYRKLQHVFKKYKVKYFVDQCEWMNVSSYRFGYFDPRYLQVCFLRKKAFFHPSGIISISRLLDNFYKEKGVRSIRIPTILDVQHISFALNRFQNTKAIQISFIGSLGSRKELLKPIIDALSSNEAFQKGLFFNIYGPTKKQIEKNIGCDIMLLDKIESCVKIHGHVPQNQISDIYLQSDFLIFIRPKRRSSDAGFPTKLAESMASGTPVITNDTGDIALYLKSSVNGFLLPNNSMEAVSECFEKLLSMKEDEYENMRKAARKTAEDYFDYKVYSKDLLDFLHHKTNETTQTN